MKLFNYIKNVKRFSIIFIPDDPSKEARSVKFSIKNLFMWLAGYSVFFIFLGFYAITLTGLDFYLLPANTGLKEADRQKIEQLNKKIIFLAKELQSLKVTNDELMNALILGDSTIFDSLQHNADSLKQQKTNAQGDVFNVIKKLFFNDAAGNGELVFVQPVLGYISRKFNPDKGHMGTDFAVKQGTPVYAAAGGYVVFSDYTIDDGYMIIMLHIDGYITVYKHCSSLIKHQRERVKQGELIALSGNTGKHTTGPHLHFEIWKDGKPIDPEKLIINNN